MKEKTVNTTKRSTKHMTHIALFTAIICIVAPFSIPIPMSPVPISLTNLILYLSIYILGYKKATLSCLLYLLLGFIGLPVYSGFSGGIGKLVGPTGGYLIGFIFLTLIAGFFVEKFSGQPLFSLMGMILGTAVCYLFGTVWLSYQLEITFVAGLSVGVIPYLIGDSIKIALALLLGPTLKKRLKNI